MAQDVTVGDKEKVRASKEALAERLGRDRFDVWFGSRVEWNLNNGCLTLKFQDDFTRDWCYRRFHGEVSAAVQSCGFSGLEVSFDVQLNRCTSTAVSTDTKRQTRVLPKAELESGSTIESGAELAKEAEVVFQVRAEEREEEAVVAFSSKDNKRGAESVAPISKQRVLTWENFVTGSCNKMATATAEMILQTPGVVTPLLVYGPCGSGKTHLVQALAHRLRKAHGSRRVIYLSSEQFTNDFMEAIRGSGLPSFRRKYRDVECLILDDIQFLAGKRATLQELKHTLDTLLRQGRQVILVADRSLQELSILGPDVQARLTGGMVCPLDGLDDTTRKTLLTRLLAEAQIKISPKVIRELAEKSSGDARVLFGLVNRLRALSLMLRGSFNDHQALEATQDLLTSCQPSVRLADIERAVCDVFGLEPKSLQAKGKTKTVSQPRMLAMFLARKYTRAAYAEIGDYFGHRRHSTVISAEKKVAEWLNDDGDQSSLDSTKIREALRNVEANLRVG
jgi:chromosomal replication initiator protein